MGVWGDNGGVLLVDLRGKVLLEVAEGANDGVVQHANDDPGALPTDVMIINIIRW